MDVMLNHKDINKKIESILGEEKRYDFRCEFRIVESGLSYNDAQDLLNAIPDYERHLYTITSSTPDNYCEDVNLALYAARRIAERNQQTYVLSLEDGTWRAAYGDWGNCAEYKGSNPAYCTCVCILKFMGKL